MYRTIVLAYDGSLEGRLALREGARLAQLCQARVVLVAVVEVGPEVYASEFGAIYATTDRSPGVQKVLDEGLERLKRMGLSPEGRLERGAPTYRHVGACCPPRTKTSEARAASPATTEAPMKAVW